MTGFAEGDRGVLTGHPGRYGWMAGMVGEVGKVEEVKSEGIPAVRLSGLLSEPFWIAERHVEAFEDEEAGA